MNLKAIIPLVAACAILSGGCATARSPVAAHPTKNRTGAGELATLGTATALGAGVGYAIKDTPGAAAIGAGVGLLTGALVNNVRSEAKAQREAELIEAAHREERVKLQQEYWEAERMDKQGGNGSSGLGVPSDREVQYAGGYFDGVNLAPRRGASAAALEEPKRP